MIHPREDEIRTALQAHWPALNYRQIGAQLGIRRYSNVRLVHEAMQAEAPALIERAVGEPVLEPEAIIADAPAPEPTPAEIVAEVPMPSPASVLVVCANCHREGTPSRERPDWCKPCAAGGARTRAAWPIPPHSEAARRAGTALLENDFPDQVRELRRRYLRARAVDFGLMEAL